MGLRDALGRLLRPDLNPVLRLLEDWPLTADDVLDTPPAQPASTQGSVPSPPQNPPM